MPFSLECSRDQAYVHRQFVQCHCCIFDVQLQCLVHVSLPRASSLSVPRHLTTLQPRSGRTQRTEGGATVASRRGRGPLRCACQSNMISQSESSRSGCNKRSLASQRSQWQHAHTQFGVRPQHTALPRSTRCQNQHQQLKDPKGCQMMMCGSCCLVSCGCSQMSNYCAGCCAPVRQWPAWCTGCVWAKQL